MLPEEKKFKYFAFISYSSKDIAWGRKIQRKLEHYRLPARLKKKDAPSRAYPVFRDETDLSGFKVRDALEKELEDSKYLIVICSPRSAASDWVNDEIRYFIDHGREHCILPFIVDGIPGSGDPATECFPPALLEMTEDPLGVDVRALGLRGAYLRMISTLLGVEYDELMLRDVRRRIAYGIAAGILACVLAVGAGATIWHNTEHSKYYRTYYSLNEIPVGVGELTAQERAAAGDCFRITTLRGRVIRLETVNSLGTVCLPGFSDATTDYPIQEYEYNEAGTLIAIVLKDGTGMEVVRKDLTVNEATNEIAVDFHAPSNALDSQALAADLSGSPLESQQGSTRSEITRQRNTYDDNGFLIRSMYHRDNLGTPACDSNGVYGKAYAYNDAGMMSRITNLDEHGDVFNCKFGWAWEEYTYDEWGNPVYSAYFDAEGNPARDKDGKHAVKASYDQYGNMIQWTALDENGDPVCTKNGYAQRSYRYDAQGLLVSQTSFDTDGLPAYDEHGIHELRNFNDEYGRPCRWECYDPEGNLIFSSVLGYAVMEILLDDQGRLLEQWCYDTAGNSIFNRTHGSCGIRHFYTDEGYHYRTEYLDKDGDPVINSAGYAVWQAELDEAGRVVREEYLDENGDLTRGTGNVAITVMSYDVFGNLISISIFDENRDPCFHKDVYSRVEYVYEDGNQVAEKYFDTQGLPMLGKDYYHEARMEYDEKGNCIRWSYYDTEGNPVDRAGGYAVIEQEYDVYGNVISQRKTGAYGKTTSDDLIYLFTWEYDRRGNLIREVRHTNFPDRLDYLIAEYKYDAYGNCIQEDRYDQNGDHISSNEEPSRCIVQYDPRGNVLQYEYAYGPDATVCYKSEFVYDNFGNPTAERYYETDASGNAVLITQNRRTYDEFGNRIRIDYLDASGLPMVNNSGYSSLVTAYSPEHYLILEEFYDEQGNPCIYDNWAFRFEYAYNPTGLLLESRRYGVDGNLLHRDSGESAITRYEYDSRGFRIRTSWFDHNDEPFTTPDNAICAIAYDVDAMGYSVGARYLGSEGQLRHETGFYAYIGDVTQGSMAEEYGVQPGHFIVRYGDWTLFDAHPVSSPFFLRYEFARSDYVEQELITCQWMEDGSFRFYRFDLPKGILGIRIMSDLCYVSILDQMEDSYLQWLAENP